MKENPFDSREVRDYLAQIDIEDVVELVRDARFFERLSNNRDLDSRSRKAYARELARRADEIYKIADGTDVPLISTNYVIVKELIKFFTKP